MDLDAKRKGMHVAMRVGEEEEWRIRLGPNPTEMDHRA
jgi:hypothetical protein